MKAFLSVILSIFYFYIAIGQNTKLIAPNDFFVEPIGSNFYPHHSIVDYFEQTAQVSPNVVLKEYGRTNEQRPLLLAFISSEENIRKLETIRLSNLKRAGQYTGTIDEIADKAIVWLSYGVHGNEASSPNAAVQTLYELLRPDNAAAKKWLENTVVIMDPSVNPDGYARYTNWVRGVSNNILNINPMAREHREPWPGGRVNHYLFDLNRDWAWCSQVESQQRIVQYRKWLPHVHVDFHEQGHENPYYFAPAAKPYHAYITPWQKEFQTTIGKNNAKHFDKEGWLYFTKEIFDLLYPSYGDTYPTFSGSIGMTYEQAGHSRAGKGIQLENGDTLKLMDRIQHHTTSGLSTIETSSLNANALVKNFAAFFNSNPQGDYVSFVISSLNGLDKLKSLAKFLDVHGIRYGRNLGKNSIRVYNYRTGKEESITIQDGDMLISAHQPMSVLTQVLFEPEPALEDSITYDITAWALPYARDLIAYASKQKITPDASYDFADPMPQLIDEEPYSYIFKWNALEDAAFLGQLLQKGVKVRYAREKFSTKTDNFGSGTLVITRADNKHLSNLDEIVQATAFQNNRSIHTSTTGFMHSGVDLGSSKVNLFTRPKVLVVFGEGTNLYSYGQVWHFMEQVIGYPFTPISKKQMTEQNLSGYNTIILTDGNYDINETMIDWIKRGGKLIAIGRAINSLNDSAFLLKKKDKNQDEKEEGQKALKRYGDQESTYISKSIPGAIYKLTLDTSHPLTYGMNKNYFSLKTSSTSYQIDEKLWNVGYIENSPQSVGFSGSVAYEQAKESVVIAHQSLGRGEVIYFVDNPLFRSFWEGGQFLMCNALFMIE